MTTAIQHPTRRHHVPVLPILAVLAAALLTAVALAIVVSATGSSGTDTPTEPATVQQPAAVHLGPNADLAPDAVTRQARTPVVVANPGPNADLAPDAVTRQAGAGATVNRGPNTDLPPQW